MRNITHYVIGLMFSPDSTKLVGILKHRPSFLAGLLNGVGGHVEEGESPASAVRREFEEETGVVTREEDWKFFHTLSGPTYVMHCFYMHSDKYMEARTTTDEPIVVIDLRAAPHAAWAPDMVSLIQLANKHTQVA
ncbi:DNA mismatch repair protein MutT [Novimethylophilus kurashikiensis]|uniref:DNA mismatch repair protein MutT n=1 Tax=Novimethylophilus kurashikiensis TaxID=1825523 RepID=A0A2R5FCU3_9PROT|nr:NUDIX domain-containing protein [Novimethylophilus kurashikiensis]GBG14464.1 DNA mismatch repair protein MutT [Novimethylophilus kurashikiensis]